MAFKATAKCQKLVASEYWNRIQRRRTWVHYTEVTGKCVSASSFAEGEQEQEGFPPRYTCKKRRMRLVIFMLGRNLLPAGFKNTGERCPRTRWTVSPRKERFRLFRRIQRYLGRFYSTVSAISFVWVNSRENIRHPLVWSRQTNEFIRKLEHATSHARRLIIPERRNWNAPTIINRGLTQYHAWLKLLADRICIWRVFTNDGNTRTAEIAAESKHRFTRLDIVYDGFVAPQSGSNCPIPRGLNI